MLLCIFIAFFTPQDILTITNSGEGLCEEFLYTLVPVIYREYIDTKNDGLKNVSPFKYG